MVLLKQCQQTHDEVRSIKDLIFPGDQAVNVGVVLEGLQGLQSYKRENQRHLVEIPRQRVDLVLRLDLANELETACQVLQELSEGLVCLIFLLLFERELLLGERRKTIVSASSGRVQMLVKMGDVRIGPLHVETLCTILDFNDVVQDGLVDSVKTARVLRALYFGSKVDLAHNQLPK